MHKKKILFIYLLSVLSCSYFAQNLIDSLSAKLDKCSNDSCTFRIKNRIAAEYLCINLSKSEEILFDLQTKVPKDDTLNFLETQYNLGNLYLVNNQVDKASEMFTNLKEQGIKLKNIKYEAKGMFGLVKCYTDKNDLSTAITIAFEALRKFEKIKDRNYESQCYARIALINYKLKNTQKAIDFNKKALEIGIKNGLQNNVAYVYNYLGNIYSADPKTHDIALEYYKRALNLRKQLGHTLEIAPILTNIGTIYLDRKNFKQAESYLKEALELNLQNNVFKSAGICYINIGNIHYELNEFDKANSNYKEALKYIPDDYEIKELLYYNLGEVNAKLGNLDVAFKYQDSSMTIKDSLYSREAIKSLNDMQVKYETEKTQLELDKKKAETKAQQTQVYAALGGCILLLGLAFFIFRGLRQKQKDNKALEQMNLIISEKSKIVEEQHKDITDSIKYAERIQTAILPPPKLWTEILPNSFVYYRPKDVLSGDFYWIEETKTHVYIAAADCTGHGVPGALVSIINYNLLNKAVLEKNLTDPAQILNQVNEWLTQALHQTYNATSMRDGMDVSLCTIEKKTKKMMFAGAFNSGYIIKDGNVDEMPADKKPVGAFIEDDITSFTSKEYQLTGKETIYLFSDGYADQFGGPKGKKFKYKNLQKMLMEGQGKSFEEQKEIVQKTFIDWKGTYEQTDDVLLIGFRFV